MGRTIAIAGLTGSVGQHVLNALESPLFKDEINFPVRAFTRDATKFTSNEVVKYYSTGDLTDVKQLESLLQGVNVFVDMTSPHVSAEPILEAAKSAGVEVFFPANYGSDYQHSQLAPIFGFVSPVAKARAMGFKVVEVKVGFFMNWNLSKEFSGAIGLDYANNVLTRYGTGDYKISFTSEEDIGRVLVSLASKPLNKLPDIVKVCSERVSVNEIATMYEEFTGNKLSVVEVSEKETMDTAKAVMERAVHGFTTDPENFSFGFKEFLDILHAVPTEPGVLQFDQDDSQFVNPGLWSWIGFREVAEKQWTTIVGGRKSHD